MTPSMVFGATPRMRRYSVVSVGGSTRIARPPIQRRKPVVLPEGSNPWLAPSTVTPNDGGTNDDGARSRSVTARGGRLTVAPTEATSFPLSRRSEERRVGKEGGWRG